MYHSVGFFKMLCILIISLLQPRNSCVSADDTCKASLNSNSWTGASAVFKDPLSEADICEAGKIVARVKCANDPRKIIYRSDQIWNRHVFRWDYRNYDEIFQKGFMLRQDQKTEDADYYNLDIYVHRSGSVADTERKSFHGFVSTTCNSGYIPQLKRKGRKGEVKVAIFRYEIFAPGGIWVKETLGQDYKFQWQDEISFPNGIHSSRILSAQAFYLIIPDGSYKTNKERMDDKLYINEGFIEPKIPPFERVWYYLVTDATLVPPPPPPPPNKRKRRQRDSPPKPPKSPQSRFALPLVKVPFPGKPAEYDYSEVVSKSFLDSSFRSVRSNEVYLFFKDGFAICNYAPGSKNDYVVNGPMYIPVGFPSLLGTVFDEYGIDAAFGSQGYRSEAFIFCGNTGAKIHYAPGSTNDDVILEGPTTITQMFPFFEGTNFEGGFDTAFESTVTNEVYIFKGAEYALVNFVERRLIAIRSIVDGFNCLRNTTFERDLDASFASHISNEAYLFKDDQYMLLHFSPGKTDDYIVGGPKEILPENWHSLVNILPRDYLGFDYNQWEEPVFERDEDDYEDEDG